MLFFTVEPEIFEMFPGLRLVIAIANGLNNKKDQPELFSAWCHTWNAVPVQLGDYDRQTHPHIKPWRDAWKLNGISSKKFPSSIESLTKRALKGGTPFSINPIVDFYNTVSLNHIAPVGAFDLEMINKPIELRLTRPSDTFHALDENSPASILDGEIAYTTGPIVLTRHFVWKQSLHGLIRPETSDIFLVSEVLGELSDEVAPSIGKAFEGGLQKYFGIDCKSILIEEDTPEISW